MLDLLCKFLIIFLLIIYQFHIMNLEHTHFPGPQLFLQPSKKKKKIRRIKRSNLCCPCVYWSMFKLPVARPLKKLSASSPRTLSEAINCRELHFSILVTILRVLFNVFLSRLLVFWQWRGSNVCGLYCHWGSCRCPWLLLPLRVIMGTMALAAAKGHVDVRDLYCHGRPWSGPCHVLTPETMWTPVIHAVTRKEVYDYSSHWMSKAGKLLLQWYWWLQTHSWKRGT